MMWLTIGDIKQHSRIDYACEDALLELYGKSAENTVLNALGKTYAELIEEYGEIPAPIRQASLMLVENSYTNRSPVTPGNLSGVPYTFDFLIKPYAKLTY